MIYFIFFSMRDKIYLKSKRKRSITTYISIIITIVILSIVLSYYFLSYFSNLVKGNATTYGEEQLRKYISIIINSATTNVDIDINKLININKNTRNEIELITYNTSEVLLILNTITSNIEENINILESGNIDKLNIPTSYKELLDESTIYEIPIGLVSNNIFLNSLGFKIPIKYMMIGNVVSHIETNATSYGINNALLEVDVYVEVSMLIYLPLTTNRVTISNKIPLTIKVVEGSVPNYYPYGYKENYSLDK